MKTRYQFLDVYRGVVVLLMIQGHVVRELLGPSLQNTASFRIHELFHGITGPGFLFGAGITFGISAQTRWDEYLGFSPALRKRLKKIILLLGIAYVLHLPFLSLSKTLTTTAEEGWRAFWSFDVLQCIGFGLLVLQLAIFIIRKERWFAITLTAVMIAVIYLAPLIWQEGKNLPAFLEYALTGTSGSVYPLIPNVAFLFAGALVSYEFLRFVRTGREAQFIRRLLVVAIALHAAGLIMDLLPVRMYDPYDYWSASPNFFLIKLGGICLVICGAWYLSQSKVIQRRPLYLRWLIIVGVESLFVYVIHLVVLYGSVLNPDFSVSRLLYQSQGWGVSTGIAILFTAVMLLLAWWWNFLKESHSILARGLNWWMGTVLFIEFIIRPY
jgi:uncharacterized membrane protein